jgi:hypothetical protein
MSPMGRLLPLTLLLLIACSAAKTGGWSEEPNPEVEQRMLQAKLKGCQQFRWRQVEQGYEVECTQDFATWTRHQLQP